MSATMTVVAAVWLALGQLNAGQVGPVQLEAAQVAAAPRSPDTTTIDALINELAASQYEVRQTAMQKLWAAGEAAIPELEKAIQSPSAEVRTRAQYVLENLRLGIGFDTPKSILREVQRFRSESVDQRRRAMQQLEAARKPRIMVSLLQSEPVDRFRTEWYRNLERCVIRTIADGNLADVEETLRRAADQDLWIRHGAAFFSQRGNVDEEIAHIPTARAAGDVHSARRLALLLRAKGDLTEACQEAGQVSLDFQLPLLLERGDWDRAAQLLAKRIQGTPPTVEADLEQLGLATACSFLAGKVEQADQFLGMLKSRGEKIAAEPQPPKDDQDQLRRERILRQWQVAKALLLNGDYDSALKLVRNDQLSFAFEVLSEQQRYREAFELVQVPYPDGFNVDWFVRAARESKENPELVASIFTVAQFAIRHSSFLGRREDAKTFFDTLVESARQDRGTSRLRMLCETAVKLGWREKATEVAAKIVQKDLQPTILSVLYPNRSGTATMWWEYFRESESGEPVPWRKIDGQFRMERVAPTVESLHATLQRVDEILQPARLRENRGEIEPVCTRVAERIATLPTAKQFEWWHELAETCLLYGRRELAIEYYEHAAAQSANDALKLGDLWGAEKKWDVAADWYAKAWKFDQDKPLPLYLQARALQRAGRDVEGKRLAELALLMPLANEDLRHELAVGLKERGFREEARQQFDLLLRTGEPQSNRTVDAAKQVGNLVYGQDETRAADCWEMMLLCCLKPSWGFVENGGYIQIPFLVHKTRAKGLLKAGKIDEALREMDASAVAAPCNVELAEELVPLLRSAGHSGEADKLFLQSTNRVRELVRDFPACSTLHNNLAWLLARCDRDLDDALVHVQRALELEPNKPTFLDTMGEVCFRQGKIAEAIASAQRCVDAEPRNPHYQAQLDRFRQAQRDN